MDSHVKSFKCAGAKTYHDWTDWNARWNTIAAPQSLTIWSNLANGKHILHPSEYKTALSLIESLPLNSNEEIQRWRNESVRGEVEVAIALILIRLPKLEMLSIGLDFHRDLYVDFALHYKAVSGNAPLLKAINLSVDHQTDKARPYHQFECLVPVLTLPGLKSASLSLPALNIGEKIPTFGSHLTSLHLYRSAIDNINLGSVLRWTPMLEELHYEHSIDTREQYGPEPHFLHADELSPSLWHVRTTLRHLLLAYEFTNDKEDYRELDWINLPGQKLEPLLAFESLESLHVPHMLMLGWDGHASKYRKIDSMLPPSIKTLTLTSDLTEFMDCEWEQEDLGHMLDMSVPFLTGHLNDDVKTFVTIKENYYHPKFVAKAKELFDNGGICFSFQDRGPPCHYVWP